MNIKKSAIIPIIAISLLTACGENAPAEIRETEREAQTISSEAAPRENSGEISESEATTEAKVTAQAETETAKEETVTEERSNIEDFLAEYDWEAQNAAGEKIERLRTSLTNDEGETVYPENYSGAYYNDGCLCIALTDISESAVKPYRDITGDDNVKFVQHKYSYNRLLVLNEYVVGLMPDSGFKIYGVGIYEKDNRVGITAGSQEDLEALKAELIARGFEEDSFEISVGEPNVLC